MDLRTDEFEQFYQKLKALSDNEIIDCFNNQVGVKGWNITRHNYLNALVQQMKDRRMDISAIGDEDGASFKSKVKIFEGKVRTL